MSLSEDPRRNRPLVSRKSRMQYAANPLNRISSTSIIKDERTQNSAKLNATHTHPISEKDLRDIIQALREQESTEECGAILNALIQPYSFASTDAITLLSSTRSTKLRLVIMEQLAPRLRDPTAHANDIMTLFKYAGAKAQVDAWLRGQVRVTRTKAYRRKSVNSPIGRFMTLPTSTVTKIPVNAAPPPSPSPDHRSPDFSPTADVTPVIDTPSLTLPAPSSTSASVQDSVCLEELLPQEAKISSFHATPTTGRAKTRRDTPYPEDMSPQPLSVIPCSALETCAEESAEESVEKVRRDTPYPSDSSATSPTPFNIAFLCKAKRCGLPPARTKQPPKSNPEKTEARQAVSVSPPPLIRVEIRRKSLSEDDSVQSPMRSDINASTDIDSSRQTPHVVNSHQPANLFQRHVKEIQLAASKIKSAIHTSDKSGRNSRRASIELLRDQRNVEKYRAIFENSAMSKQAKIPQL